MSTSQTFLAGLRRVVCSARLPVRSLRLWQGPLGRLRYLIRLSQTLVLALVSIAVTLPLRAQKSALEEVATFPQQQVTGVTVSSEGRVFVNFPFWSDDHLLSVAEIIDGRPVPFPDEAWNAKSGPPEARWVCVQSVVVDDQGALWDSRPGIAED